jgi:dynamin 1-like protein
VDLVYEELQRISSQCEPGELTRFPNLRDRLVEVVNGLLKRAVGPTQMMVSNLVKIELAYINTSHPDFIGGSRAVAQLMRKLEKEKEAMRTGKAVNTGVGATPLSSTSLNNYMGENNKENSNNGTAPGQSVAPPLVDSGEGGILNFVFGRGKTPVKPTKSIFGTPLGGGAAGPPSIVQLPQVPDTMRQTDSPITDREKIEMEIIKSLIESYFNIVRKNFIDMVPKTIMYFLVNHVRDAMQNELVAELYRDVELPSLMKEADDVAQRRKTCVEMKDLLSMALEIVNEVRDFNTFK